MERHASRQRQKLNALTAQLEMLNPQRTLERGYAIVTDPKGKILRAPEELKPRSGVTIRLAGGSAQVEIASVQTVLGE
jgi:exodeoxyribonuclease VII large subunit